MLTFKAKNIREFTADLSRFQSKMSMDVWLKAAQRIYKSFRKHEAKVFSTEGGDTRSGRWKDLSEKYGAWKAAHYPGRGIMVLSGKLRKSLTKQSDDSVFYVNRHGSAWRIALGTQVPYAEYHQEGGGKLPVRRLLDPPDDIRREWLREIHREIVYAARPCKTLFERATERAATIR